MSFNKLPSITALIYNQKELQLIEFGMSYVPSGSEVFKDYHHDIFSDFHIPTSQVKVTVLICLPLASEALGKGWILWDFW